MSRRRVYYLDMNKYREIRCTKCKQPRKIVSFKWLREVRLKKGLSVRRVAIMAHCSPAYISQIELGQANPTEDIERLYEKLEG